MDENNRNSFNSIMLDVLKTFDAFCTANGLDYFAAGGTALGAVRHKGFIPWDDDIDVYMPRKDYERFLSLRSELPEPYKVLALGDKDFIYPYAKMFDASTELVEYEDYPNCKIGVFVDVFPIDESEPYNERVARRKERFTLLYNYFRKTYMKRDLKTLRMLFEKRYFKSLLIVLACEPVKRLIRKRFLDFCKEWSNEKGDCYLYHGCTYELRKEIYPKKWFSSYRYGPFEDINIRLSDETDAYLTQLFGDYMTPPPEEKRASGHSHFYLNLHKS